MLTMMTFEQRAVVNERETRWVSKEEYFRRKEQ